MESLNYPPEKLYSPSKLKKPNYDHLILWMLFNNEACRWADFCQEPLEIPTGTLSRHLVKLKRKGFVENFTRGQYRITAEGKKQFYDLSRGKKKTLKPNYPPKIILKSGRNYSDWILWMVYNNNSCKRSDFLEDPLSINQSSLTKSLHGLLEEGFITKEEGKYIITKAGKSEYSRMLQKYDLDRQTILEEEGKRIEEITKKTKHFFNIYKVKDKEIQFNFLNYILKLDYERVKPLLKKEDIFYKIVLFFAMNHPDRYSDFISPEDFSRIYKIRKITLDYYVDEISAGKIYPTRFFKLDGPSGGVYYFQSDGKIEKMLEIITETKINKNVYLSKLFSNTTNIIPNLEVSLVIEQILEESCEFLFHKDFKESLKEFIPEFIKYLRYKLEIKKELKDMYGKLEVIIWQDLVAAFDSQINVNLKSQYEEQIEEIDRKLELDPENIELYNSKIRILIYFNQYNEVLSVLDKMLEVFPEEEINVLMKKASIYKKKKDLEAGLEIIEDLIAKYPENNDLLSYKGLWFQYMDKKEEALDIIQKLIDTEPKKGIYYDTYGEILMYFEQYEEAVKRFLKSLLMGKDEWYIYQTYIKMGICYNALGNPDLAVKNLEKGKETINKSSIDPDLKQKWLVIADLFLAEI